jgi:hypothetical protein
MGKNNNDSSGKRSRTLVSNQKGIRDPQGSQQGGIKIPLSLAIIAAIVSGAVVIAVIIYVFTET